MAVYTGPSPVEGDEHPHGLHLSDVEVLTLDAVLDVIGLPGQQDVVRGLADAVAEAAGEARDRIRDAEYASGSTSRPIVLGGSSQGTDFETNQEES